MAITIDEKQSTEDRKVIVFDNGDWQKANQLWKDWDFVDVQSLFRAMMSILILTKKTDKKEVALINSDDTLTKATINKDYFNTK